MASLTELFGEELLGKAGPVKTSDALAGKKNIMIYFSAHWCPPCRGFTPQLAAKYKSFAADQNIEIVFASSDQDESQFNSYYGEMPWLALPFSNRSLKETLAQKFECKGIPMLVVLDDKGNLVTADGRGKVDEFLRAGGGGGGGPSASLAGLFGEELLGKAGPVKTTDALAGKKNIMIYFSAHWCPPCRGFTPQLAAKYKSFAADQNIEIVFASSDQDESQFNSYYGEMPWLALPFSNRSLKETLAQKFECKGIPMLVVLDDKGNLVTAEGRGKVDEFLHAGGGGGGGGGGGSSGTSPCCVIS